VSLIFRRDILNRANGPPILVSSIQIPNFSTFSSLFSLFLFFIESRVFYIIMSIRESAAKRRAAVSCSSKPPCPLRAIVKRGYVSGTSFPKLREGKIRPSAGRVNCDVEDKSPTKNPYVNAVNARISDHDRLL